MTVAVVSWVLGILTTWVGAWRKSFFCTLLGMILFVGGVVLVHEEDPGFHHLTPEQTCVLTAELPDSVTAGLGFPECEGS